MTGKQKCMILKQIRAEIAQQNDINLVIEACNHKGECRGTCPRCESEVRYLEAELEKRRSLKKAIALAGISAGMTVALSGCAVMDALVDSPIGDTIYDLIKPAHTYNPDIDVLEGEVPYDGGLELMGDVAYYSDPADAPAPSPLPTEAPQ